MKDGKRKTWKPFLKKGGGNRKGGRKGSKKGKALVAAGKAADGKDGGGGGGYNPSEENPCRICGSAKHWARDCPNKPVGLVDELDGEESIGSGAMHSSGGVSYL